MGFFADEPEKKPERGVVPDQQHHGFFAAAGLMILGFILTIAGWILKPLFSWLFDFKEVSREIIGVKILFIVALFGVPLYLVYKIPSVRDALTLSETHTVNLMTGGERFIFPDRSYFIPGEERKTLPSQQYGAITYITYGGYTKNLFLEVIQGVCYLVPRGERIALASKERPLYAAGFENTITYTVSHGVYEASLLRYMMHRITTPKLWFASNETLRSYTITYNTEEPWDTFKVAWNDIVSIENSNKPFLIKAMAHEHALICF